MIISVTTLPTRSSGRACDLCGGPIRSDNHHGVCKRSPECTAENLRRVGSRRREANPGRAAAYQRERRKTNPEAVDRAKRRWVETHPEASRALNLKAVRKYKLTNVATVREAGREAKRRARLVNPEAIRVAKRRYYQRTDRPCRYAKNGCTEFASPGCAACRRHRNEDAVRRRARKAARLSKKLSAAQGYICPWCLKALPDDCTRTHIDHIIPQSLDGPDVEWNWQVLHDRCNEQKGAQITPAALALAAEHGIALPAKVTTR